MGAREVEKTVEPALTAGLDTPPTVPWWRQYASSHRGRALAAAVLALALVAWVGKGVVLGHSSTESPSSVTTQGSVVLGQGHHVAVPRAPSHQLILLDGHTIPPAGAVITLNPALAQPGENMDVSGSGFDPGSMVDLVVSVGGAKQGTSVGVVKADKSGNINTQVPMTNDLVGPSVLVTAQEEDSTKVADAQATAATGVGTVELSKTVAKPGDVVMVSAQGFSPGEPIDLYWGRASGPPAATLQADTAGDLSKVPTQVGTGVVGQTALVLVGAKSGTAATASFQMLGLYPTAQTTPYAVQAMKTLSLSAKGFAPNEPVGVYVNTASGQPLTTVGADPQGNLSGVSLQVPYGLSGEQNIVMIGERSRASVKTGFEVLPYTPSAQPSTYSGAAGTSFSFFATGFGPNEVVLVYLDDPRGGQGQLVTAFRVGANGNAAASGSFQVDATDTGTLHFTLLGRQSAGKATVSFNVSPSTGPVSGIPARQPYVLPPSLAQDPSATQGQAPPAQPPANHGPTTHHGAKGHHGTRGPKGHHGTRGHKPQRRGARGRR